MNIVMGSDHAGFELKEKIKELLVGNPNYSYEIVDVGTNDQQSCHYPEYAQEVCRQLNKMPLTSRGILVCGSGIGVSMVANRFKGMRAALCRDQLEAQLAREHNNANIICLGSRIVGEAQVESIIMTFLTTAFAQGRHQLRVDMFDQLGEIIE